MDRIEQKRIIILFCPIHPAYPAALAILLILFLALSDVALMLRIFYSISLAYKFAKN